MGQGLQFGWLQDEILFLRLKRADDHTELSLKCFSTSLSVTVRFSRRENPLTIALQCLHRT